MLGSLKRGSVSFFVVLPALMIVCLLGAMTMTPADFHCWTRRWRNR
jgi:hypothetical protein